MGKGSSKDSLADIVSFCPHVNSSNCEITSDATTRYNCVGLAVGDDKRWWEPTPGAQYYWPLTRHGDYSLQAYVDMFASLGFAGCDSAVVEDDYEKIVLYADQDSEFTRVALQSRLGCWMSKLGDLEDVEHTNPEALAGPAYGNPVLYMKRKCEWPARLL